jgi:hypothetical protein
MQGCTTTFVYEIIPTAIMLPPNRCKVAITATASYDGRTFEAKQTSMVISMPMRYAPDAESMDNLIKFDAQVHDRLVMMISKLTSLPHAPQFKSLIYKCQLLIDSFDERFGFYMPDYYQARDLYLRTMRGEIGPLYVAEHAYNWEEVYFGDFFNMCMATYEKYEPKTVLGRVLLGVATLGYSEIIYYTPKRFLLECQNAAFENPDSGFFSNFAVGAKFAYMEALESYKGKLVMGYAAGKLSSSQFGQALKMCILVDVKLSFRTQQFALHLSTVVYPQLTVQPFGILYSLLAEVPVQSGDYAASAVWRLFTVLEVPDVAEDV